MALIGDQSIFAIETTCLPSVPGDKYHFGTFSLIVDGTRIGSSTYQVTLNSVLFGLGWWKETIGQRNSSELMHADTQTAYLSIEAARYGLDHLGAKISANFKPIPVEEPGRFEVLEVDGLETHRIYCIEDDMTTRILIADAEYTLREYRVPRPLFSAVMTATIKQLEACLNP